MRVDFYQLGASPLEQVVAKLAEKLLGDDERLLVVAEDDALLARLDRALWDQGAAGFLPHGISGGAEDSRQPVLLSATPDPANRARNIMTADGKWRDAALSFSRVFHLFDSSTIEEARSAWRSLAGRPDVERHFWAQESGRWIEKASDSGTAA